LRTDTLFILFMDKLRNKLRQYPLAVKLYLFLKKCLGWLRFIRDYWSYHAVLGGDRRFVLRWRDAQPCLVDWTEKTGFEPHYVYHPAWAVRKVKEISPEKHVDISSTLHFASMLSAYIPVDFYDYRPAAFFLPGLNCGSADLMKLPFADGSVESISCMHTIEHIGLGRYGDPINPSGDLRAAKELVRVTARGGNLLVVVPVGRSRLCFNAHRIYSHAQLLGMFEGVSLKEFALVPDDYLEKGLLYDEEAERVVDSQEWGCGCYWFVKK
jgi:hypothetical protein